MVPKRLTNAYVPDIVPEKDLEYFEKGGFGTRTGWGENAAIIIVDMTTQFTDERSNEGTAATNANESLLEVARENDVLVIYTKPDRAFPDDYKARATKPKHQDSKSVGENSIHPRLAPNDNEILLYKPRASAFFDTHLNNILSYYNIDTVIITGMTTSGCVRATVVDAHSSNYNTIVPYECVADRSKISHEISLFDIDMKYADVEPLEDTIETLESL